MRAALRKNIYAKNFGALLAGFYENHKITLANILAAELEPALAKSS
jgi:hypothetical protein